MTSHAVFLEAMEWIKALVRTQNSSGITDMVSPVRVYSLYAVFCPKCTLTLGITALLYMYCGSVTFLRMIKRYAFRTIFRSSVRNFLKYELQFLLTTYNFQVCEVRIVSKFVVR
jgi:hypothetical protein